MLNFSRPAVLGRYFTLAPPSESWSSIVASLEGKTGHGKNIIYPQAPSQLQEFSVVYTDRALNHMSEPFVSAMQDISNILCEAYSAETCAIIPGSGSFAMEAVVRQYTSKNDTVLILRNGLFSYRWSQIIERCGLEAKEIVLCAEAEDSSVPFSEMQYVPCPIEEVISQVLSEKPRVVFAPHVETSTGIYLPDGYIKKLSGAVHAVGGLMVLDCIASGGAWVDMAELEIDVLISAPQKSWSGPACAGFVVLSESAVDRMVSTHSSSFTCDLLKWCQVMQAYEAGGFMYHCTMPTDSLVKVRNAMLETQAVGFEITKEKTWELGDLVNNLFKNKGLVRVAAPGFEAPGVIVLHQNDAEMVAKFRKTGVQVAAGVPFMIGEPKATQTFRVGLFGLDKLKDPHLTTAVLGDALESALSA